MIARDGCLPLLALLFAARPAWAIHTDEEVLARLSAARDQAAAIDKRFAAAEVRHAMVPEHDIFVVVLPLDNKLWFRARLDAYDGNEGRRTPWSETIEEDAYVASRTMGGSTAISLRIPLTLYSKRIARIFRRALQWCST